MQAMDDRTETEKLRAGLAAAMRAANLALFLLERHGIQPNDSWRAGFDRDMKAAKEAAGDAR
jgi:hypothetical protein